MIPLIVISLLLLLLYSLGTRNFNYWSKRRIPYCKPVPFFGNGFKKFVGLTSPTDQIAQIYRNYPKAKCVGCFESNHPALVLRDPELIKHVLVTDFLHFHAKGMNMYYTEPILYNLFSADGDMWKLLRQKLSVAFSTGKHKAMYPALKDQVDRLQKIVHEASMTQEEVDVRDLMARFTTDAIVACGFGVDANTLNNRTSIFRKLGKRIFNINLRDYLVFISKFIATDTFKNLKFFAPEIENVVTDIMKNIFDSRDNKPTSRKDFIDVLLDLQSKKILNGESMTKRDKNGIPQECEIAIDNRLLVAQAFILFGAGYETAAATMSFTLNQLAYHPEIQKKCQAEIDEVLHKYGTITYEAISELKYIDMVFREGLRMYPPIGFLIRQCGMKYTFPDTNLSIDKGVAILIPLQAIQNDEKYFDQPLKFIPERFHPSNVENINKFAYLPFGGGPRTCIGMRFGTTESILGDATILSKHAVVPSVNSRRNLITDPTLALVQNIKGGIPLKFVPRT